MNSKKSNLDRAEFSIGATLDKLDEQFKQLGDNIKKRAGSNVRAAGGTSDVERSEESGNSTN